MSTDKRFPRTLQEAFGPYTDSHIHEPPKTLFAWLPRRVLTQREAADRYQQDAIDEANSREIPE